MLLNKTCFLNQILGQYCFKVILRSFCILKAGDRPDWKSDNGLPSIHKFMSAAAYSGRETSTQFAPGSPT